MDKHLQNVLLAALESLRSTLSVGSDASFLEDIIDPEEIDIKDIRELEARIEGLRPERLVINLDGGLVQSVCANTDLFSALEVYVSDLDIEGAGDDEVETLVGVDNDEWETCIRKEAIESGCAFDIDKNIQRIFAKE